MVGGASLAATFRELGLIDEHLLHVSPVILAAGRPLFPATGLRTWVTPLRPRPSATEW
ncbi:dihydrofolate reductase family protein [Rhodococcus sp. X156]|uniref:dihydrofolate reductase family protein n=1 Tax=Rhodococcus sp. X156 TaxID=2499145 RepID=UPI000FDCCB65|nr:dihydrofolate reductase family protein [Rhodococcus sp. X156]